MCGEMYHIMDRCTGQVEGLAGAFAAGNAETGKGNILSSLKRGRAVRSTCWNTIWSGRSAVLKRSSRMWRRTRRRRWSLWPIGWQNRPRFQPSGWPASWPK